MTEEDSFNSYSQAATQTLEDYEEDGNLSLCGSQEDLPDYWGRLYPATPSVRFHDLSKNVINVGKTKACDICLQVEEVSAPVWNVVSREHFTIVRTSVEDQWGISYKVQLKDLSMNGTYINGVNVGKGNTRSLKDDSVIALGRSQNEVFYYKDCWAPSKVIPIIQRKYDVGVRLGTGAFGEVHMVFNKKTGRALAMKTILKGSRLNQKKINSELQKLENEVTILRRIRHPNVIQLIDDIDCDDEKYLFLELMVGKDLFQRITNGRRLTERISKLYFYQMAKGVEYLHRNGITHRDLKPENILLATPEEETLLKITDFGLSKAVHSETYLMSLCGTKLYAAPEVLESGGLKKYTKQVDVWSMGAVLYVSLSGSTPFFKDKHGKTMEDQIKTGDYSMHSKEWEGVSDGAKLIIKKMMTVNPSVRITIDELLEDPWLKDPPMLAIAQALADQALAIDEETQPEDHLNQASRSPRPPEAPQLSSEENPPEYFSDEGYVQMEDFAAPNSPAPPEVVLSPQKKRLKCT